ncbi:NPCBM/NEW2 domain-containing protein [Nonomuraea sp. AD125B]|uniref:NPCBM/NEW2 domain-containing protein n=2 Tax=Nonomuraea TaxID=83681 RepID=UPI00352968EF
MGGMATGWIQVGAQDATPTATITVTAPALNDATPSSKSNFLTEDHSNKPASTTSAGPETSEPSSPTMPLLGLTPVQETLTVGSANLNARSYKQALLVPFCFELGRPVSQAYVIGRKYDRLRALAGLADDSPEEIPLTFAIYGDGKRLFTKEARQAGEAIPIDISVKNILRVELVILAPEGNEQVCNPDLETFVWAAARLE